MDSRSLRLEGVNNVGSTHGFPVGRITGHNCLNSFTKGPSALQKTLNVTSGILAFTLFRRLSRASGAPVRDESCEMNKMFMELDFLRVVNDGCPCRFDTEA